MLNIGTMNPQQRDAVMHREGPLLVLAGAGSGKTRVIITRIAKLISDGVSPNQILGVTFTNKAAREMRWRLRQLVPSRETASQVTLSTFHSLGLSIVRAEHHLLGLNEKFCIYDQSDQVGLVRELMRRDRVADRRLDVQRVLALILRTKKSNLNEVPIDSGDDYELAAHLLYNKYLEHLRAFQAVDFDDLLLLALKALSNRECAERWQRRYRFLLIDEYQDTSAEQLKLVQYLGGDSQNICAVGDDDQSIYSWRGAEPKSILNFSRHFQGAVEVVLEQNYRSTNAILRAANRVIEKNSMRKVKQLWSQRGAGEQISVVRCRDSETEAQWVSNKIQTLIHSGVSPQQIAVLYRSNLQSRIFEETLGLDGVSFVVVGGQSFFERKEVKDVLAYLQVINNPFNELALRRVINVPARGVGPKAVEKIGAFAKSQGISFWRAANQFDEAGVSGVAAKGLEIFIDLVRQWQPKLTAMSSENAEQQVDGFISATGIREAVIKSDDAPSVTERRIDNLRHVTKGMGRMARRMGQGADILGHYLNNVALEPRDSDEGEARQDVTLMTIHASKGLEFEYVFFVGVEEDILPHKKTVDMGGDISEERRLCYVAMTRAKDRLWMTHCAHRKTRGAILPVTRSRFIDDIGEAEFVRYVDSDNEAPPSKNLAEDTLASIRKKLGIDDDA